LCFFSCPTGTGTVYPVGYTASQIPLMETKLLITN
jgi:hypothetical protein